MNLLPCVLILHAPFVDYHMIKTAVRQNASLCTQYPQTTCNTWVMSNGGRGLSTRSLLQHASDEQWLECTVIAASFSSAHNSWKRSWQQSDCYNFPPSQVPSQSHCLSTCTFYVSAFLPQSLTVSHQSWPHGSTVSSSRPESLSAPLCSHPDHRKSRQSILRRSRQHQGRSFQGHEGFSQRKWLVWTCSHGSVASHHERVHPLLTLQ